MVTNQARYLHFNNISIDSPCVVSSCSRCGQEFTAERKPDEKIDDVILQVRQDFNAHECSNA